MRIPRLSPLVLALLVAAAIAGSASTLAAQLPGPSTSLTSPIPATPVPMPIPTRIPPVDLTLTLARPRAGILPATAGAENFPLHRGVAPDDPLGRVASGKRFRLQAAYEAVFFPRSAGRALFTMEVARINSDGTRTPLGRDERLEIGTGPSLKWGTVHVDLSFQAPGIYALAVTLRTTAHTLTSNTPTVDEDELIIYVVILPASAEALQVLPAPTPSSDDTAVPIFTAAMPRGHMVTATATRTVGAAENFDRGHGSTITIRQGGTIGFRAEYEFAWYAGAVATTTANVALEVFQERGPALISLGADRDSFEDVIGPRREAGVLVVDVPFREPGEYHLVVRVRTAMQGPIAPVAVAPMIFDQDDIAVLVKVWPQPETGGIIGQVTAEDTGLGLPDVPVRVFPLDSPLPYLIEGRTREDGSYAIANLPPGAYLVQADPKLQNYLPEWYDDAPTREKATPVKVQGGQITPHIDFALTPGATIAGRVTAMKGSLPAFLPEGGVTVQVGDFASNKVVGTARSLDDGTYAIDRLRAGRYWVYAAEPEENLLGQWYDRKDSLKEADPVEVGAGQVVTGVNFALVQGGSISGQVVDDPSPAARPSIPLAGIKVEATDWLSGTLAGRAETTRDGRYKIPSLQPGRYRVYAHDDAGRYVAEYYDNVTDPQAATPVTVTVGHDTPDINFALAPIPRTLVRIDPPVSAVQQGSGPFTVTVAIDNVTNLGGFEFELAYNPAVVHVRDIHLGPFLGSSGRQVQPLGPEIDNQRGWAHFGGMSTGNAPGATGSGKLALITLLPRAEGESVLDLQEVKLSTPDGTPITTDVQDGKVRIGGCIFGDVNCDCRVDMQDVALVALHWGAEKGDPEYDPVYDVDDDGDIDIFDIQLVVGAWGHTCTQSVEPTVSMEAEARPAAITATGLRLSPATLQATAGTTVTWQVMITEAVDIGTFQFSLAFDPLVLRAEAVRLGPFLGTSGKAVMEGVQKLNEPDGTLHFGATTLGKGAGATGYGQLAELVFRVIGPGSTAVTFTDVLILDSFAQRQPSPATQGASLEATGGARLFLPLISR